MGRCVADVALMLDAQSYFDSRDPPVVASPPPLPMRMQYELRERRNGLATPAIWASEKSNRKSTVYAETPRLSSLMPGPQ